MVDIERIDGMSMNMEAENMEKLRSVFPQCFSDGKLDIDKLLNLCGEYIEPGQEKYKFDWNGKAESYKLAGKRSTGTLRPCKEDSVNFDTTKNLYIEGDNLEVLKLLQTAYFRKVKMIYIDPPYNTGKLHLVHIILTGQFFMLKTVKKDYILFLKQKVQPNYLI